MRKVFVIGDSHRGMFERIHANKNSDLDPNPKIDYKVCEIIGSNTAFSICQHKTKIIEEIEANRDREVWFVFGEIDTRFHVYYHAQLQNISTDQMCDIVANKYLDFILELRNLGYNINVVGVVPTQNFNNFDYDPCNPKTRADGGDQFHRRYNVEIMNAKLKYNCSRLQIPFIDVYPFLVDCNGFLASRVVKTEIDRSHAHYIGDLVSNFIME